MIKYILKLFGYKIMSIRMYENERKMSSIVAKVLRDKIMILVTKPDSPEVNDIKALIIWELEYEHMMWFGKPSTDKQMKGILNQIPKD